MLLPVQVSFDNSTVLDQVHVQSFPSRMVLVSILVAVSSSGLPHLSERSRMISERVWLHVE